jgi:CRISPR-associated protein Cmr2
MTTTTSMRYFHFTLGPVQGFVSQARRTRDFWAGSFLLSWLSGVAMVATEKLGGKDAIEFPKPPAGYLDWIVGEGKGDYPRQGAIPNRFKAQVPAGFDGNLVAEAVRKAWVALAERVWNKDLAPFLTDATERARVREIWDRQHAHFWEISWVVTEDPTRSNLLDRRKNWRSHLPPAEPGRKCMVMEGWQELSGLDGVAEGQNRKFREFWKRLREGMAAGRTDLREGEALCALAFVKRRFVRSFGDFEDSVALGAVSIPLKGWPLKPNVPSTAYMAAVHWLKKLLENADRAELEALCNRAKAAGAECGEWDTRIHCLDQALEKNGLKAEGRKFIALDGRLFFESLLQQPEADGLNPKIADFRKLLKDFGDSKPAFKEAVLSPFYAVLLMDGDSLGAHMGTPKNQPRIAAALNAFTAKEAVPAIVERHNGFLIYAGGDDVLALLPLEDALTCAVEVRAKYAECFQGTDIPTTLSGAVIYAHVKTALGEVLRQSHHVLDDIAKDGAGRDAIAVRVLKPGGEHLTWAQPWDIALRGKTDKNVLISGIAAAFRNADAGQEAGRFSSKFFYKMRERFEVLEGLGEAMKDSAIQVNTHDAATNVLAADYIASGPAKENGVAVALARAREIIVPLLDQCCPAKRDPNIKAAEDWPRDKPKADAALLVRFLAQKGVDRR